MQSNKYTNKRFSSVPSVDVNRSTFDRSSPHKGTYNFDDVFPIFIDEVLPGDTFNMKSNGFGRLATPINPVMDNMQYSEF